MKKFYMVGTNHRDLKGPGRLEKFLEFVRPDMIGVGSTEEDYIDRIEDHERLKSYEIPLKLRLSQEHGVEKAAVIMKYLNSLGYESWVPYEFSRRNTGAKVTPCDKFEKEKVISIMNRVLGNGDISAEFLSRSPSIEELSNLDFEKYQSQMDLVYHLSSINGFEEDPEMFRNLFLIRDYWAELNIRKVFSRTENTMVYVGGAMHIFGDYHNLYERLSDLVPFRIKLPDMDNF